MLVTMSMTSVAADELRPRIAIIIDDLGYRLDLGRRAVDLPGPVAVAVLPGTPRGRQLAARAVQQGKEVLLHLPLQAMRAPLDAEPGALSLDMTRDEFARAFAASMADVPNAIGVNTHRGSLLTRHPGHMTWLMQEIRARNGLFFIDSYTTHESIALQIAAESGVRALKRDVFLDPDEARDTVVQEFERLKVLARQRGFAIGIGHPYPATMELLESALPRLRNEGIDLVPVSELLQPATAKLALCYISDCGPDSSR